MTALNSKAKDMAENLFEHKIDKESPIGFMDSGVGGISVLREAVRVLPGEDFIYYGDSANAPYGTKSPEKIKELTFGAVDKLMEHGIKALVVACNTATSAAIKDLRLTYSHMPIIGIEPAVKPAVVCSRGGRIIVMATPMTIVQPKFRELVRIYDSEAEIVPLACDGLMEMVEQGISEGDELVKYFDEHLKPVLTDDTESIVLGCTHYPFLTGAIRDYLGNRNIMLIDGSKGTSSQLKQRLADAGLLRTDGHEGKVTMMNSSEDPKMIELSWRLFNEV